MKKIDLNELSLSKLDKSELSNIKGGGFWDYCVLVSKLIVAITIDEPLKHLSNNFGKGLADGSK